MTERGEMVKKREREKIEGIREIERERSEGEKGGLKRNSYIHSLPGTSPSITVPQLSTAHIGPPPPTLLKKEGKKKTRKMNLGHTSKLNL